MSVMKYRILRYLIHLLKPKPVAELSDLTSFKDLDAIWRPSDNKPGVILRWFMTEWCNYNCPYCSQKHGRNRVKGSFRVHSFDNYPPNEWVKAMDRNFMDKKVAFTITGGEPMIDVKNMRMFLSELLSRRYIDNIRVDTNMSWNPSHFRNLPNKEKMIFMCTLHTSETKIGNFISRVERLRELGFAVGIINYVMIPKQSLPYERLMRKFKDIGLPLHPNPLWDSRPNEDVKRILQIALADIDIFYRTGGRSKGKICYYPSIAFEMNQNGDIAIGCFPQVYGNIFKDDLPELPNGPVKCPHYTCYCLDKYSFIKGINRNLELNILKVYGKIIRKHLGITPNNHIIDRLY